MFRIFLYIAIVGGIAATTLSAWKVREVMMNTMTERNGFHDERDQARKERDDTKKTLAATKKDLESTTAKLTQTQSELATANNKVTDLENQNKDLASTLTRTRGERDSAQQILDKWRQIGLEPEQVKAVIADRDELRKKSDAYLAENKVISHDRDDWKKKYLDIVGNNEVVVEPVGLKGKIIDVDPKFGFVVLDIGADNGVVERGEMLVNRSGQFVGKVKIVSVEKNRSIANIIPDWTRGVINEECAVID